MSKKKIKFVLDSLISWIFCILAIILFLLDTFILSGKLNKTVFLSPTNSLGALPFDFSDPISILRLVLYAFGGLQINCILFSLIIILLTGRKMEEYYGSLVIGIMMFVAVLVSGVLSASFYNKSIYGSSPIIFMLVFLDLFINLSKKKITLENILLIVFVILNDLLKNGKADYIGMLICLFGGLCGSLFALLASPKGRANAKKELAIAELDANSPRFANKKTTKSNKAKRKAPEPITSKKNPESNPSEEETIIGTLKL